MDAGWYHINYRLMQYANQLFVWAVNCCDIMKIIFTKKGQQILVSDEDYPYLSQFTWSITKSGHVQRTQSFFMHREIMKCAKGLEVDHRNRTPHDNRRENLRICNHSQNMANAKSRKKNKTSKYKGVYLKDIKLKKPWVVSVRQHNKQRYIGYYKTELEAAISYDKVALEFFGEFALLNFPLNVI